MDALQQLVDELAQMSIWDFDNDEGNPYSECEEPAEGYLDSHVALMFLIEKARRIKLAQEGVT